jgi:hypothetical protein
MVPRSSSAADERNSGSVLKKALHPRATILNRDLMAPVVEVAEKTLQRLAALTDFLHGMLRIQSRCIKVAAAGALSSCMATSSALAGFVSRQCQLSRHLHFHFVRSDRAIDRGPLAPTTPRRVLPTVGPRPMRLVVCRAWQPSDRWRSAAGTSATIAPIKSHGRGAAENAAAASRCLNDDGSSPLLS